jgi:hypothetical protein
LRSYAAAAVDFPGFPIHLDAVRKRVLGLVALTAGSVLAVYAVVNVALHVVRTARLRSAVEQAVAEAESAPTPVAVPSPAAPEAASTPAPAVAIAALSSRELARQSVPATVSLHCARASAAASSSSPT